MKPLLRLGLLLVLSVWLYAAVVMSVRRPLVVGEVARQIHAKEERARALGSPKLLILAGSNGRYSHACAALAAPLALPCVNGSVGVGIGLDFQLERWLKLLGPGDVVYLPLEYGQYRASRSEMQAGLHQALLLHHFRRELFAQGVPATLRAVASFDLHQIVNGLGETLLHHAGVRRRSGPDSLTPEGDERGHTEAASRAWAASLRVAVPEPTTVPQDSYALQVLGRFLDAARLRGALVVGGLPTIPDDAPLAAADVHRLAQHYGGHGQRFIALPNLSRYPRSCFHDTLYHLHEECQQRHSAALGAALAAVVSGAP